MGALAITMYKGDTKLTITVPSATLAATGHGTSGLGDFSTGSIWFTAKHSRNDPDTAGAGFPQAVFQKTLAAANLAITTAGSSSVAGVLTATLVDADTSGLYDLENGLPLYYDIKGKTSGGQEQTLISDFLIVLPHSTKAS